MELVRNRWLLISYLKPGTRLAIEEVLGSGAHSSHMPWAHAHFESDWINFSLAGVEVSVITSRLPVVGRWLS